MTAIGKEAYRRRSRRGHQVTMEKSYHTKKDAGDPPSRWETARLAMRSFLYNLILAETPWIVWLQKFRTPLLDFIFGRFMTVLGTHTMFLIGLPICFWFSDARFARHLTLMLGIGVMIVNYFKDLFCLPRPASPPVQRLLHSSKSLHPFEYGLPSTHAANSASICLFSAIYFGQQWWESPLLSEFSRWFIFAVWLLYGIFLPLSRVYCGMHSFTDITFGTCIGLAVSLIEWLFAYEPIESWIMQQPYPHDGLFHFLTPLAGLLTLALFFLVIVHPDPQDPCPCFDDSLCFAGVFVGMMVGSFRQGSVYLHGGWGPQRHELDENLSWRWQFGEVLWESAYRHRETLVLQLSVKALLIRLVMGIVLVLSWRFFAKKTLNFILLPFYERMSWPLYYHHLNNPLLSDEDVPYAHAISKTETGKSLKDDTKQIYVLPRHALDAVIKIICYTGIGWVSVDIVPSIFSYLEI